jgi:hypothetical protein
VQTAKLEALVPGVVRLGRSVSLWGDAALVGAHLSDAGAGSAHVFEKSGAAWSLVANLKASDAAQGDWFGSSVSLYGSSAFVGAYLADHAAGTNAGAAYAFEKQGGVWSQTSKIVAGDALPGDYFAISVALSGSVVLVGAPFGDSSTVDSGSAYVFEKLGATWLQVHEIAGADSGAGDGLGVDVALEGDRAIVGAYGDDVAGQDSGSAYVFDLLPLSSSVTTVSLASGGTQPLSIDAGHLHGSELYLLLGSASGTSPGLPLGPGLLLPLNQDAYLLYTLVNPNSPPLASSFGMLGPGGSAAASFGLPPGSDPALVGIVLHHACVAITLPVLIASFASNAFPVLLVP